MSHLATTPGAPCRCGNPAFASAPGTEHETPEERFCGGCWRQSWRAPPSLESQPRERRRPQQGQAGGCGLSPPLRPATTPQNTAGSARGAIVPAASQHAGWGGA